MSPNNAVYLSSSQLPASSAHVHEITARIQNALLPVPLGGTIAPLHGGADAVSVSYLFDTCFRVLLCACRAS